MSWLDDIKKMAVDALRKDIEQMTKSEGDKIGDSAQPLNAPQEDGLVASRAAMLTDPFYEQQGSNYFLTRQKISRISNRTLREISMRDWLVNTILQIRADTVVRFSRPTHSRYEMGYRVFKRNIEDSVTDEDKANIRKLEDYIYNCGRVDSTPRGEEMVFGEFLKLVVWDALSQGHIALEKVLTRSGSLHRFRPLPAESIYRTNPRNPRNVLDQQLKTAVDLYAKKRSDNDPRGDGQVNAPDLAYYKYVQLSADNRPMMVFGDEDMVFKLFNPKNFPDANGYSISMVEQAVIMITNHLNVESYNANYFTHGYAARGILHLKGNITQNSLGAFRRQFYNTISGANNAWRTPIVAGLDDVSWIPMSGSAREMEYINFNSHIMRSICAQFQIDPIEVGLDYLTTANGRAANSAKESGQFKITYSRERGLVPLLMFVEDVINHDIIPALDKTLAEQYVFKFVGYNDETPQTDISLRQAQMTVFSTMNDLLKGEGKKLIDHPIAEIPLNTNFWTIAEKNMTRGEIREHLLGDKGAATRRELAYIPADPAFQAWQQLLMTVDAQKKQAEQQEAQAAAQEEQAKHEREMEQNKNKREQEMHDHAVEAHKNMSAQAAVDASPTEALRENAKKFGETQAEHIGGQIQRNPINVGSETDK